MRPHISVLSLLLTLHCTDKVAPGLRDAANSKFQEIAFAYAILSDATRRNHYDSTGSLREAYADDFDWKDYFKAQYAETVTTETLNNFKKTYQGSVEERRDVLDAYEWNNGSITGVFDDVIFSNALADEGRFRKYIDSAIAAGEVESLDDYANETEAGKAKRKKLAERESAEAIQHAKDIGVYESVFGDGESGSGTQNDLASLIQQRQKQRGNAFLEEMAAKYGPRKTTKMRRTKKKKRKIDDAFSRELEKSRRGGDQEPADDEEDEEDEQDSPVLEPPEEAFKANAARPRRLRKAPQRAEISDAGESLGGEDTDENENEGLHQDEDEESAEDVSEEVPRPRKRVKRTAQPKARAKAKAEAKAKPSSKKGRLQAKP